MVARSVRMDCDDESSIHLLYQHPSRSHSDLSYFMDHANAAHAPPAKQARHKHRRFLHLLQCAIGRKILTTSSQSTSPETVTLSADQKDLFCTTANTSLSEAREGPPDALSTVSSQLTTSTFQKRQRTLLTHWKTRMNKGIRKILRADKKDEEAPVEDTDWFVYPPDALYAIYRNRSASAFRDLTMPTLSSPTTSNQEQDDGGSTRAGYSTEGADFPLESVDAGYLEEIEVNEHGIVTRSMSLSSIVQPHDSTVSVAFDHHYAQLVFMPSHSFVSDTDDDAFDVEAYQTDAPSKASDDDDDESDFVEPSFFDQTNVPSTDWDDDETEFSDTGRNQLGAAFSHPSAGLSQVFSEESDEQPLGISKHPWKNRNTKNTRRTSRNDDELWSEVEQPPLDGELTEPPSPTVVERTSLWCGLGQTLGWSGSEESDVTMSAFVCNDIPRLPKFPMWKRHGDEEEHPFDEVDIEDKGERKVNSERKFIEEQNVRRKRQVNKTNQNESSQPSFSTILSQKFETFVLTTLGHQEVDLDDEDSFFSRYSAPTSHKKHPKCYCVKCAAKGIYEDLIKTSGGSPD